MNNTDIKEFINNLADEYKGGNYIFRGTPEIWSTQENGRGINSTLYRKCVENEDSWNEHFKPTDVGEELVEKVRIRLKQYRHSTNIEILTDLRHYGAKVTLIDFSCDIYTALFFACNGEVVVKEDGELIMLKSSGAPHIDDVNYENDTWEIIKPAKTETTLNRVESQKSIFVYAPSGFIPKGSCIIKKIKAENKKGILDYLKKYHNISEGTIYNDLVGFIKNEENYDSSWAAFYKGLSLIEKGNFREAIKFYNEAIEPDPNFVEAYVNRGFTKGSVGDHEGAIKDSNKAIELDPDIVEPYVNRGVAKHAIGDHKGAVKDYNKAIELDPDFAKPYMNRGVVKYVMGNRKGAVKDYNKAIKLDPDFPLPYTNRGFARDIMEDHKGAIKDYNKAIELDPDCAEAYTGRGNVKRKVRDYEGAIEDHDKAIGLDPDFADAYMNKGIVKYFMRDNRGAIEYHNKAIELDPDFVEAYINRGNAKHIMGDYEGAIADWEEAIRLDPNYEAKLRRFIKLAKKDLRKLSKVSKRHNSPPA